MADPTINVALQWAQRGAALAGRGELVAAMEAYRQAVAAWPGFAEGHASLGSLLAAQGRHGEAVEAYHQALRLKPGFAECHFLLGNLLLLMGQMAAAEPYFREALRHMPNHVETLHGLGIVCKQRGDWAQALSCFDTVVALRPEYAEAHVNRGATLETLGRFEEALAAHQRGVALQPGHPEMHVRLGATLAALGRFEEAAAADRRTLELQPGHFEALNNLGIALRMLGRVDEAAESFRRATVSRPQEGDAWTNLGVLLDLKGERGEALACHRRAVALLPADAAVHSNLLYALHFHPGIDARTLLEEHREWDRVHAAALRAQVAPHTNTRDPERRLRIGYVSPDFRDHPVGRFMAPLVAAHGARAVEVFCYADEMVADGITEEIRRHAHHWRALNRMNETQAAALIRQDQIDILVDLTMHMAGNRLLVFARKPAPVQVTYLAYCSTTGLGTMDYRLSDPYLDPPGADVSGYSEETVRLPAYWCYAGSAAAPLANDPPGLAGPITFGCLNGFNKVSGAALAVWGRVLLAVPGSRLMLHANPGNHRERVWRELERMGVERGRCEFVGLSGLADYFRTYHRLDVALDPFPYAGGTTTCDALWMGVPVVTLCGTRAVGRGGVSILSTLGIPEWIADTEDAYVGVAARLAGDMTALRSWRSGLRARMQASALMDAPGFARHMEEAFRFMWRKWCAGGA